MDRQRARRLANAAGKALQWKQDRDALIVEEHQAGAGLREIGRIVDLSHPAVKKIVEKHALCQHAPCDCPPFGTPEYFALIDARHGRTPRATREATGDA